MSFSKTFKFEDNDNLFEDASFNKIFISKFEDDDKLFEDVTVVTTTIITTDEDKKDACTMTETEEEEEELSFFEALALEEVQLKSILAEDMCFTSLLIPHLMLLTSITGEKNGKKIRAGRGKMQLQTKRTMIKLINAALQHITIGELLAVATIADPSSLTKNRAESFNSIRDKIWELCNNAYYNGRPAFDNFKSLLENCFKE